MTPTPPTITLVLGPSLGTSAAACWGPTISLLHDEFDVVAWELPGHGQDAGHLTADVTVSGLAARVLDAVDGPFLYAGDSVGGQVGLQLLLDAPERVLGAVLCCTGAKIGDDQVWDDRIAHVRSSGTASLVPMAAERWFADGFLDREPNRASALLHALRDTVDDGYVAICQALRSFDVRDRLGEITSPVVAVAGAQDPTCPPVMLDEIAEGVAQGRLVVLENVAHQAPAEAPESIAEIIRDLGTHVRKGWSREFA
jgi:3-oxoadipate enol-lactonase/4-carboxymuconolactone decarboxylase